MFQKHYSRFLEALGDQLHFAAHSHHAWPDVSREAHLQYWDDSNRLIDDKWEHIFTQIIPHTQKLIAGMLHLKDPTQIAFAPNTHELINRLLSTFNPKKPIRILTTSNEFHSFRRQIMRMAEAEQIIVTRINADLLAHDRIGFLSDLKEKLTGGSFDFLFMSQVFFDSGLAISSDELESVVAAAPKHTVVCIDGYHAFAALPVNLSPLEGRIFYLGGGYKYAQAGEGACFMVVPKGDWRPINTGWFAEMATLSGPKSDLIAYPSNGSAFLGSTADPSGFYRFNAVWDLFAREGITVEKIHSYVKDLQDQFLVGLSETKLSEYPLMNPQHHGHFLTFDLGSAQACAEFANSLRKKGIWTDYRGQRLRFGFGIYQTKESVQKLLALLKR